MFAFWLFQAAFCGSADTIVAGGMAERMKFPAYLIYSFLISALVDTIILELRIGKYRPDGEGNILGRTIFALITIWIISKKADLSMTMNSALASLGVGTNGLFLGGGFAQLGIQLLGALSVAAFVLGGMGIIFLIIDKTIGLRVSEDEEYLGLDIGEHGMESYSGFQIID